MGRRRTGSVYQRTSDGRWVAVVSVGGGRRQSRHASSEAEARELLAGLGGYLPTRTATEDTYGDRVRRIVDDVLTRAEAGAWDRPHTLDVFVASLTSRRLRYGVTGPCVYCGTDLASTADHSVPIADGGDERPENIVSACVSCNARKGRRRDFPDESAVSSAVNDDDAKV